MVCTRTSPESGSSHTIPPESHKTGKRKVKQTFPPDKNYNKPVIINLFFNGLHDHKAGSSRNTRITATNRNMYLPHTNHFFIKITSDK